MRWNGKRPDAGRRLVRCQALRRVVLLLAVWGFGLAPVGCSNSDDGASPSRFTLRESLTSDAVRLEVTNPTGLTQAEDLLASGKTRWAMGTLRRGDGGFNGPWPWHLDPATVTFAEFTIEACQTEASAIAADLDYWIEFGQVCIAGVVESRER